MKTIKVENSIHRKIKMEVAKRGLNMSQLIDLAINVLISQNTAKAKQATD
jgi:hypothetical protein